MLWFNLFYFLKRVWHFGTVVIWFSFRLFTFIIVITFSFIACTSSDFWQFESLNNLLQTGEKQFCTFLHLSCVISVWTFVRVSCSLNLKSQAYRLLALTSWMFLSYISSICFLMIESSSWSLSAKKASNILQISCVSYGENLRHKVNPLTFHAFFIWSSMSRSAYFS